MADWSGTYGKPPSGPSSGISDRLYDVACLFRGSFTVPPQNYSQDPSFSHAMRESMAFGMAQRQIPARMAGKR